MDIERTFYDWEDSFRDLENVTADVYVNGTLKITDVYFDKINIYRRKSRLLNICFYTKERVHSDLINKEVKPYDFEIRII